MDRIKLFCTAIEHREGYDVVYLSFESIDPTLSSGGIVSFTIADASSFVLGHCYNLALNEIPTP